MGIGPVPTKIFVCMTYGSNAHFVWYVGVETTSTSIETRTVFLGNFVLSIKFRKSVVSFRYECCSCAIG